MFQHLLMPVDGTPPEAAFRKALNSPPPSAPASRCCM